ncbi:MAG: hypothetical protein L6R35_001382 [Caloplaca aegaea]|nr:MAG: hypothetical protein L6R35_001382 [Caloplaca aegaea]
MDILDMGQQCTFLISLPGEIRNTIYALVLGNRHLRIQESGDPPRQRRIRHEEIMDKETLGKIMVYHVSAHVGPAPFEATTREPLALSRFENDARFLLGETNAKIAQHGHIRARCGPKRYRHSSMLFTLAKPQRHSATDYQSGGLERSLEATPLQSRLSIRHTVVF